MRTSRHSRSADFLHHLSGGTALSGVSEKRAFTLPLRSLVIQQDKIEEEDEKSIDSIDFSCVYWHLVTHGRQAVLF